MSEQKAEIDDQGLSDFHRDYLMRYMEHEQRKQERTSASFRKERADALDAERIKASHNQS